MQTTDQVAGEAREKLADHIERLAKTPSLCIGDDFREAIQQLGRAVYPFSAQITAALRAQPERGAEEMRALYSSLREAEPTIMLTTISDGPAVEMIIEDRVAAINCYEALEAVIALPLHPDKDEGGGR